MSVPIKHCDLVEAIDHPETLDELKAKIRFNVEHGSMSVIGCRCDPPCRELSEAEYEQLNRQCGLVSDDEE